jgi:hypothetical protein
MNIANSFASLVIVRNEFFLITVLSLLAFSGCSKEEDAKPAVASMTLTGNLDGKPWQADGFLVERHGAAVAAEEHVVIQSRSNTGAIRLYLNLYGVDKPGTYSVDSKTNARHEDARLEITGTPQGFSTFFGWGPATYTITRVKGKRYTGTFSASFYDTARGKTIELKDGKLHVWEGIQAE